MSEYPSVGRIVHYLSHGSPVRLDGTQKYEAKCRAAVVTEVHGDYVTALAVLNPSGLFFDQEVEFDAIGFKTGSWHWPECDDAS